jgi:hypothetical protein
VYAELYSLQSSDQATMGAAPVAVPQ